MSALTPAGDGDDLEFDLDRHRAARREARHVPALRMEGKRYELPIELPVDVFEPLTQLNMDVSVLIRQVLDVRKQAEENDESANLAIMSAVIDMLVVNPKLPQDLVEAVKEMGRRLLGDEAYAVLARSRPSKDDLGDLVKYLAGQYGVSLGEASRSSGSSKEPGTTSRPTSRGGAKTSGTSTGGRRTRAS